MVDPMAVCLRVLERLAMYSRCANLIGAEDLAMYYSEGFITLFEHWDVMAKARIVAIEGEAADAQLKGATAG